MDIKLFYCNRKKDLCGALDACDSCKFRDDSGGEYKTIDMKPVVYGKWIPKETMIRHPWAFNNYCSVCKSDVNKLTPYCPNCGADMRGEARNADD